MSTRHGGYGHDCWEGCEAVTTPTQAQARALVEEVRRNHHIDLLHRYDNEPPVPHCAVCGFTPEPCDGLILADALSASLAREEGLRENATLVANSLDDVARIGWGRSVDPKNWARQNAETLREALASTEPASPVMSWSCMQCDPARLLGASDICPTCGMKLA